jgi:hypothetical protein
MPPSLTISITSPLLLALAAGAAAIAVVVWVLRRGSAPRGPLLLVVLGAVAMVLAAGQPFVQWPRIGHVAVMVDVSPSTRTAAFRRQPELLQRISQLLGDLPHTVYHFAHDIVPTQDDQAPREMFAERTRLAPPRADAVVLFSDARFDPPADAPPTYVAVDAALERPADARVSRIEWRGDEIAAAIVNGGDLPRRLTWSGVSAAPATVPGGASLVVAAPSRDATAATVTLEPGDAWPENDTLTIRAPPPALAPKWWVGPSPPDATWTAMSSDALPTDQASYLAPQVIVLNNQSAADYSRAQLERIDQYVRTLGGALVIFGGDAAFSAGAYVGTPLDALSPLASSPPTAATHWLILVDASGSMAARAEDGSRWTEAGQALGDLIGSLPPEDPVSVGGFARDLNWWSTGRTAAQTAMQPLPPPDVQPHGPTNLEPALRGLIDSSDGALPAHAIVLTDGQAKLESIDALAEAMRARRITLNVLATATLAADHPLARLASATGGTLLTEADPRAWSTAARQLAASHADPLSRQAVTVNFADRLQAPASRTIPAWNRTWPRPSSSAFVTGQIDGQAVTLGAQFDRGAGTVAAVAFAPTPPEAIAIADAVARPPRDPRLIVRWTDDVRLHLSVDATTPTAALNNLRISMTLLEDDGTPRQVHTVPQVGPGLYALEIDPPSRPMLAIVTVEDRVVDRIALAGRYAPEFARIGNDRPAMSRLANTTGGTVIEPDVTAPIDFHWPTRRLPLIAPLSAAAAAFILLALALWRR